MDPKTKELVDEAERHAEKPDNYDVAEHARDDIPALCGVIREQDAEGEKLRAMLAAIVQLHDHANALSNQGESGKIFERACDAYRDAINEARALTSTSP